MTRKQIAEKILTLTPKEVITAMVEGLKNPYAVVDMNTYGRIRDGVCYGCAATNAVMYLDKKLNKNLLIITSKNKQDLVIKLFESTIDALRTGSLYRVNNLLSHLNISAIKNPNKLSLPYLDTSNYKEHLHVFEQLANDQ